MRDKPAEKVLAVVGIFNALLTELPDTVAFFDPGVQAALIDSATKIAMATDTKDMGLMAPEPHADH